MERQQALIHSIYWISAFVIFTLCYSFIDSISQGLIYASVSVPLTIGITYLFIYWAVPSFLFKGRNILFALLTATILLGVLNIQIVFALVQRIFLADNIGAESAFIPWDTLYLIIATILFSLPAIAYETLRNWNNKQQEMLQLHQNDKEEYIQVMSDGKTYRIACGDIHFIESYGDYAHIHSADRKIITRMTLKKLDELLPNFVRVHRSYIVNPDFCQAFNLDEIIIDKKEIPVGRTYKETVSNVFSSQ
ncbi:LytTR family transcriptional regulator [Aliifodinibius salicampi]|uniref:LytTR family transcriptional regulator n=1 Tax=Fodinibius salicampi TaxID=1920655 RepID=A0ABT3PZQ3_9BACT|nr:LytTR family DNA-binding domain-containing protein [Fodinibius salicampi]MCW9713353.1 LytTR family transcriptional regulator [Fodinibius salicampi]